MDQTEFSSFAGANCSLTNVPTKDIIISSTSKPKQILIPLELPPNLSVISNSSMVCVFAYCVVFVIATSGNLIVFNSLRKEYARKHSRISLLLLHLAIADLVVCFTLIPTEVFWRLTIQWWGGNLLCKVIQFLRAFGLYLSSLVLICVSVDRLFAILFPLNAIKLEYYKRVKYMIILAWILAGVFSVPQIIFFGVEVHPEFSKFEQCVATGFLEDSKDVKIYSIFSVVAMYLIPLVVILFTYSAIILKLIRKSRQRYSLNYGASVRTTLVRNRSTKINGNSEAHQHIRTSLHLRCNGNGETNMSKAKSRTLLMTVVIVIAFVLCWTPYAVMTLWYMFDWSGASEVDPGIQDGLFLMAVGNSCINPIIYGSFRNRKYKFLTCSHC